MKMSMTLKWIAYFRIYMAFKLYFNWSMFILYDTEFHKDILMQVYKVHWVYYLPVPCHLPIFPFPLPLVLVFP